MKNATVVKKLLILSFVCIANVAFAQIHPLAFGASNWYQNYVGASFHVTAPAIIAGDKAYAPAITGSGGWPDMVYTPIINVQVVMPPATDSEGASPFAAGSMTGKICLIWRGPLSSPVSFAQKALCAQNAGAVACVVMNEIAGSLPFSPGYTTGVGTITIPVVMIGNSDGIAIEYQYNLSPGSVRMTISSWGQNNNNDLGFVPNGIAGWHNYAIPYNQLFSSGSPMAYKGMDGAFIANYGSHNATHVKVSDTLRYTPTGLGTSVIHTDVSPTLAVFHPSDSIYAMLAPAEYNFAPTGSGTGRFDLKYTISSDSVDQYLTDNTATYSFYTTDSVYSKGKYDFVNNVPARGIYEAVVGTDFLWGPMYYVAHGGSAISSAQFSIYGSAAGTIGLGSINIYAMKWVDGSGGMPLDGLVQNGELSLAALGVYTFSGTDTSGGVFKVQMGDPSTGIPGAPILLDSNSWYYIAADVPLGYFLGCDGQQSPYPRVYSRYHTSGNVDYSGVVFSGDYSTLTGTPGSGDSPCPFPATYYINSIDSFNYSIQKQGLIPAIALIVNNHPLYITGADSICVGATTTYVDTATGGTWSSSTPSVATVGSSSGVVTGVSAGTAIITYTLLSRFTTKTITINPLPAAIIGTSSLCAGSTTSLIDGTGGGTWSSGTPTVATIDVSGTVTSVSAGTTIITYALATGCVATSGITVNPLPSVITGTLAVCVGATTTLSDTLVGGTWSSLTTTVATIGAGTGIVSGVSSGTTIITYMLGTGCAIHATVTVNPLPSTISGTAIVCAGATTNLSDATSSGTWSSSGTGIATVSSGGIVTGVSAGIATITYSLPTGCNTTTAVTVNPLPTAGTITGIDSVCPGTTVTLSDAATGGVWSSSDITLATIDATGLVTGMSTGAVTITYAVTNSCGTADSVFSINVLPLTSCPSYVNTITVVPTSIKVYPNPNEGVFTVFISSDIDEPVVITITNIVGEKVQEFSYTTNRPYDIQVHVPSGIYFLSAVTSHGKWNQKMIIKAN